MTTTNVAELKSHLSRYLSLVERGEAVEVCKRNIAIAQIVPIATVPKNLTKLGSGLGTVKIKSDLTEPALDSGEWEMLGETQ
jgi:antitoxin (DNA-binding transcriptional repressor) of toxin-antitoxin stability system